MKCLKVKQKTEKNVAFVSSIKNSVFMRPPFCEHSQDLVLDGKEFKFDKAKCEGEQEKFP